ncbi:hypothetical protein GCM10009431_21100 [Gaetbulibacter jejuensis]|uniref:Uncharacterized protein n=1 Tax=Gaetbulibacter jejuensis TaxID=584607 RepID=A0ABN1JSE0_9FLAO
MDLMTNLEPTSNNMLSSRCIYIIVPEMLKVLSKLNFLLKKVDIINIVANMLTPIIILITSLYPVNLTTPLWDPTAKKLIKAANTTKGSCLSINVRLKTRLKLNLIK